MTGHLFVISGPSGSGKTTIVNKLILNLNDKVSLERVITYTSRSPRVGEIHGIDYHFISNEEFEIKAKDNFFIEYSNTYGAYYGSPKDILKKLVQGISFIMILDKDGALNVKASYPDAILIWITTDNIEELNKRLELRKSETQEQINHRLYLATKEMKFDTNNNVFDYKLINKELESSFNLLKDYLLNKLRSNQ